MPLSLITSYQLPHSTLNSSNRGHVDLFVWASASFKKPCDLGLQLPNVLQLRCFLQVASWGAYLLSRDILVMSFAPRDSHEAQVQFALERGVPAMIGVLSSNRLTYPARAFDMAHCSRCLIPWQLYGMYHFDCHQTTSS